jgi:putative spermidine/putrescine transport system permease protein
MGRPAATDYDDVAFGWRVLDAVIAAKARLRLGGRGRALGRYLLVVPGLALVAILAYGIALLAWRSFHSFDPFYYTQGGFSFENYERLANDSSISEAFVRTIGVALVASTIAVAAALPFAYSMSRTSSRALRMFLLVAVFFPFLTGDIVRVYGWLAVLGREGAVSWVITSIGLDRLDILGTIFAVAIGEVQILLPLCVMMLLPAFYRVDRELEQAAATMGARPIAVWRLVVLPLIRPGIAAAFALGIAVSMTDFAIPGLLGQGLQDFVANKVQSITLARDNQYLGSALGVTLLAVIAVMVGAVLGLGRGRAGARR